MDDACVALPTFTTGAGDPSLAKQVLGWRAQFDVDYVVDQMCAAVVRSAELTVAAGTAFEATGKGIWTGEQIETGIDYWYHRAGWGVSRRVLLGKGL